MLTTQTCAERMKSLRCVVVIPTYNNQGTIARVVADVKQYCDDVIVVNDGCTDRTAEILEGIPDIKVLAYKCNRGKGYALKLALKEAYKMGFEYALTIDADGQHYASDIPAFVEAISEEPGSLIVGARNLTADNMPSKNTFANKFSNFWYWAETGIKLSDTQSGFRLYPLARLQKIWFITTRYEFEVEIIVRAAWRGVTVKNIPIKVYYPPQGERVSHFRPLADFTRISLLNTVLVLFALIFYYPWRFFRMLNHENITTFFRKQVIESRDSNLRLALAMGWGAFCSIIPIWGYQMAFAGITAHLMRLNKVVALAFSQLSIFPCIPFILYGSVWFGALVLNIDNVFLLKEMSLETLDLTLRQYLIGSMVLAAIVGVVVGLLSLLVLTLCKRKVRYE